MYKDRRERRELADIKFHSWEIPQTLIIELDGALIDSISTLYNIYKVFLQKHGYVGSRTEFNELLGLPLPEYLFELSGIHGLRKSLEILQQEYQILLRQFYTTQLNLVPGVQEFLSTANQLGLTLCVVSGFEKKFVRGFLKEKQLLEAFEVVVSIPETDVVLENIPNLYQNALTILGTESEDAIAIVSSAHAVEDSKEAGILTWWLSSHGKSHIRSTADQKDCLPIKDWGVIQEFLQKRFE